ncbi:MAG TPA: type II toxin-antitoxin system VapC family toxin [Candidatus Limnocylindria bacterium]|nr:type II toxin-antitoxin system VapC family toxin [Candidatus Limnocylindria bacterium]
MPAIDVVSDASVVLKWFHAEGEEEVEPARALLEQYGRQVIGLQVLDLTPYEVGNALLRGRASVTADRVAVVLEALSGICPQVSPTIGELREAATLAELHGLTIYDAAYAAVASARGAELATLDHALLKSGLGRRPSAVLAGLT